ncbi:uncharacterized protein [Littorina saxatilis]|uniref:Uncharacterized protein n=1 Tax=Littorina saxatilis TaxID=31220 RepID=A0AAN9GCJ8_9CAEN
MGVLRVWYPALVGIKAGTNVLVAGGTGIVGSGTVISLLKQGAKVLVATRSLDKFCVLHDVVSDDVKANLSVVEGDLSTYDGVKRVFKKASTGEHSVNHVVASIGNYWQKGWLTEQTLAEFNRSQRTVVSHFLMMRTFLPYLNLREGTPTYTVVTGHAGDEYIAPKTSFLSVGSGALNSLSMAARAEFNDQRVALNQFHIRCSVQPVPDHDLLPDPFNVGHDLIGGAIASSISSVARGKTVINTKQDAKKMILAQ